MEPPPEIAREVPPLSRLGKLLVEGMPQDRNCYFTHLQEVYRHNKEAFDVFWKRHPELKEEETGIPT
jgi:hypothetical protein